MNRLIDQEIAHISRVMWPSLLGDMGGAILSSEYWRMRLHALLDAPSLTKVQLCALDSLLLRLDHYDRRGPDAYSTPADDRSERTAEPVALHG
ncbi:hypothetical protein ACFQ3P_09900 [Paraburkholderia sabiae]|jgi:hypothetical protein|uniref:Uncharacterized protein n=1 Tax=Paraburkholderia sabiae TaxID=273251 RepID=A0ABU9Q5M9_9BURK|nr:hypothetical protein [Paraburkholderia sabiae]WJZ74236.1 hypothetical protein QEN71_29640 [Paraburkholderia sabiae]CAD6522039.1 hypothetical protein LMG24235_01510 [Paraburkholderia sabiae]CAG9237907.1 conserved hypothetical protein [Paraburkholderia sabiae]